MLFWAKRLPVFQLLVIVEQIAGSQLPPYAFTSEISMLSEHKCVVDYLTDVTITHATIALTKITH